MSSSFSLVCSQPWLHHFLCWFPHSSNRIILSCPRPLCTSFWLSSARSGMDPPLIWLLWSPSPDIPFTPSRSYVWVNGLWYTSLSLSLITALVASLVKQWMHQYMAATSGTPRDRCMIRQYRYDGYEKWGVSFIVGTLPVLMHLSLGLFFIGLTVYLIQLYLPLAYITGSLAGITYIAYFISHVISATYLQCPYRTPLANLLFILPTPATYHTIRFLLWLVYSISSLPFYMMPSIYKI
ncbi:hypothetical protein BDZ89DRAFT_1233012, partial [Hymenopellis radicata]